MDENYFTICVHVTLIKVQFGCGLQIIFILSDAKRSGGNCDFAWWQIEYSLYIHFRRKVKGRNWKIGTHHYFKRQVSPSYRPQNHLCLCYSHLTIPFCLEIRFRIGKWKFPYQFKDFSIGSILYTHVFLIENSCFRSEI